MHMRYINPQVVSIAKAIPNRSSCHDFYRPYARFLIDFNSAPSIRVCQPGTRTLHMQRPHPRGWGRV